jgi:hypothetical protein
MRRSKRVRSRREPSPEAGPDASADEWVTVTLGCPQFTADLIVGRLESEGIEIHRPPLSRIGPLAGASVFQGQRIGFRWSDRDAVARALRDAGLPALPDP